MRALPLRIETTSGASSGAPLRRRESRSVGSRGNHSARMRRLFAKPAESAIVTTPLHHPASGLSLPVARQFRVEARTSPIVDSRRAAAAHQPAGLRRAWFDLRLAAQEEGRDALR